MSDTPTSPGPATAADFEETPDVKIWRLENQLRLTRRHAARATRQLHAAVAADLRDARRRAVQAERRAERAEAAARDARRRTRQMAAELERIKASSTWKAGRAVLAVPIRIKRWGRS